MKKKAHIYVNYKNIVVLESYLDNIQAALELVGYSCDKIISLSGISKRDLIVFSMGTDAYKFYHMGYKHFLLWQQGVTAEESYMRNRSKIRMKILNYIDCFAMKKSKFIFFVSDYMKSHYQKISHKSFGDKSYIMPCYNEQLDSSIFDKKDYSRKTFAYVGSMDLWQCFDQTAELYSKIEQVLPEVFFKVLTFNTSEAERIIKKYSIENYEVKSVPKDEVKKELESVTYGFILRDDIEVNRVATPTKISSYLSAGIIPIYSSCLMDFANIATGKHFAIPFTIGSENTDELINNVKKEINSLLVEAEICEIFDSYYCTEKHIRRISSRMKGAGI